MFSKFKVKHLITSAYHLQTNGQDERTNRTIKTALAKLINQDKNNWDDFINPVLFAIHTSQQASTKVSPYMAMIGRKPNLFCEIESEGKCKHEAEMEQNDVEEKSKQVPEKEQKGDKSGNNQSEEKCDQAAEIEINDIDEKTKQNYKQVPEKEQKGDKSDNNQSEENCKQAAEMEINDVEEKSKHVPEKKKEGDKSDDKQSDEKYKQAAEMEMNDVEEKTKQNYKQVPGKEQKGDKSNNNQSEKNMCKLAAEM